MSRPKEYAGTAEAAEILGVSRQRVLQLARDSKTFPAPLAVLSMGRLWDADEIRKWAADRDGGGRA